MPKTKIRTNQSFIVFAIVVMLTAAVVAMPTVTEAVSEQQLRTRIDNLSESIAESEEKLVALADKKDTLRNRMKKLDLEIGKFQQQIELTEKRVAQTQDELVDAEAELEQKKQILYANTTALYKEGDPSTAEILFSSDNLSDFVNRQAYLERTKESINEAVREVVALKVELEEKQADLETLLAEQQSQQNLLRSKKQEQARLLAETRGEESRYQAKLEEEEQKLSEAVASLQTELASRTQSIEFGSSSYPYARECMNPYLAPSQINEGNCGWDTGYYFYRQCTSYAYWRRGNMGRPVPGGWGNGGDWAANARTAGYRVNAKPSKGAIGVVPGYFGHVFIVEDVLYGGNAVRASQYNVPGANGGMWGEYSEVIYTDLTGIQFIHDKR